MNKALSGGGSSAEHFHWKRPPFIANPVLRYGLLTAFVVYFAYVFNTLEVNPERIVRGIPRAMQIFSGAIPPDFSARGKLIFTGFIESIQITFLATFAGVLLSIPFAFAAARNIAILPIYGLGRGIIIVARSLHPVVLGVLFVKAVGFGAFAGVLTLIIYTLGFVGKLLAEAIEEIKHGQIEAIRSTGAGYFSVLVYAVLPQIMPRLIGLTMYQLDINLRASAVIGLVGAGGIGNTLNSAFGRYDYGTASAILLVMIIIILFAESVSSRLRRFTR
ncbi:phosphonate ABC transporter, permease protein PhnE [Marispirochaeta aestuarii]|uniref:phosphonate ABC transporter, permease protein PhnE n=1 Tax=Marispirochaeta aestuarii TaxID=1963862 RepID=UPI0029C61F6F|nr:phosphonate ABC transporter, permease protein PhnE [Marispirochaeta aestuarii]